jgi:hypothetical protein
LAYGGRSKEYLDHYIAKYNTTVELLIKSGQERMRLNAEYYLAIERQSGVKIFLVCDPSQMSVLNRTSSRHRLISYYMIRGINRNRFEDAVYMRQQ